MPRNLWIGLPGRLREISQAATAFERGAELGVTQFTSLGGQVTTLAPQRSARRTKFTFDRLSEDDAAHLDRLARRIDGPGPVSVIDPVTRNLLDPLQAEGRSPGAPASLYWYVSGGTGKFHPNTRANEAPGTYWWAPGSAASELGWHRRPGAGFPVAPGMELRFTLPTAWRAGRCTARLHWRDAAGALLSSATADGQTVTATAPAGAAFVTPAGVGGEAGWYPLGGAVLTIGDPHVPSSPVSLLSADQAAGRGPTTQWETQGVTLSTDAEGYVVASLPANTSGWINLVHPGQPGHPVPGPGFVGLVFPAALRARASSCSYTYFNAAGTFVGFSTAWEVSQVAPTGTQVAVGVSFHAAPTAFSARLGPTKLLHIDSTVPQLAGEGCPAMAVTGYTDSPARPLPYRNISIDLTEVTGASN
ncbi:hypothetical protein ABZX72_20070 [Streptomyces cyaneofuscatus]|uniref:hypothetical protein n=1 Tax=Streptomyces cyaneofuscatus TaxID=66883 RepID=UPI0033BE75C7